MKGYAEKIIWLVVIAGLYLYPVPKSTNQSPAAKSIGKETLDYFLEVAMGSEYEGSSPTIKRWDSDIRIKVIGSPSPEDLKTLQAVKRELNSLISSIEITLVERNPSLEVYFVPVSQFAKYEPNYKPSNYGFCWVGWKDDVIYKSRVLISTVGITQKERSHLIREELTQALGLMKDSDRYAESIFYAGWTDSTKYAEIDKVLLQMLYSPGVRPGMNKAQLLETFNSGGQNGT